MNNNQKVVLSWLKNRQSENEESPLLTLSNFGWMHFGNELPDDVERAYKKMNKTEDYEVMGEFVRLGLEECK